jgi:multidrug efflux system membrane fusion protein
MKAKAFFIIIAIGIVFQSCKNNEKTNPANQDIVNVKTINLEEGEFTFPIHTSGVMASKTEIKLSFKTGGIISSVMADEGQNVQKGQMLAKLNLSEIEAQVKKARLGLEKANRDFKRAKNLYKDSVATLEQFQNAETALDIAKSQLQIAEFNLQYSMIKAPENGKILKKLAEQNEVIGPGYPVFLFGSGKSDWVLRTSLSDRDIVKISYNDTAFISYDAFPNKTFKAIVSEKANASDPYTGTFEVELKLLDRNTQFVNGLVGKAKIVPAEKTKCKVLPISAIHEADGDAAYVFIAKNNDFEKRKIKIIKIFNESVLIEDGITKQEQVITDGADYLEEGSKISIVK